MIRDQEQMLRPMALLAELTYLCPLKCPYCSNPLELARYREELSTEEWLRVLREAAELGVIHIHFSGGEPLARADLEEIIREARRLELYSNLSTGATLADEARLARLREAGLDALQISVLDVEPESNDRLAGAASFEKKKAAARAAKRLGFPLTLNIVLHRQNLDRIGRIIAMAEEWGADKLELAHTQYVGWAFRNRDALLPTREQVERAAESVESARVRAAGNMEILHVMPDYFQDRPKACMHGWGRVFMTVAPDGAALPCPTAREIPGIDFPNVRTSSLSDIWERSTAFLRFRGTDWMPDPCRTCDRREIDFGGCRCQAFLVTGDAAATDPVCALSPNRLRIDETLAKTRSNIPLQYRILAGGEKNAGIAP